MQKEKKRAFTGKELILAKIIEKGFIMYYRIKLLLEVCFIDGQGTISYPLKHLLASETK